MAPRKRRPSGKSGLVIVKSFIHYITKKRVTRPDGGAFAFYPKKKKAA